MSHAEKLESDPIDAETLAAYARSLELLDNVVRECISVSQQYQGLRVPSTKHFYSSVLFTALISRGVTLTILAPHSSWSEKIIEHWDYASAAMIVRSMMEIRAAFHYLCIDPCSDEEWQCRWNLLNCMIALPGYDCFQRALTQRPNNLTDLMLKPRSCEIGYEAIGILRNSPIRRVY